jgi:glycerol-3-phosphate cytidylyltransferase
MIIGYTTGVYDLFHVGHLNILKNAKSVCDKLIVGVTTDELLYEYKNKRPVIPHSERMQIIANIKCVDAVVPQKTMDKYDAWERYKFNVMIVGDDWYKKEKWEKLEREFKNTDVKIIYYPYTVGTSSTLINEILENERKKLD